MKTFFFNLKIPLRYLQPPNYSHVAGPDEKVKSVRKERGSHPKPSPAQPCSGHPHVTCVPSTDSASHLCWGHGIHGVTSPWSCQPRLSPAGWHPSVFPAFLLSFHFCLLSGAQWVWGQELPLLMTHPLPSSAVLLPDQALCTPVLCLWSPERSPAASLLLPQC